MFHLMKTPRRFALLLLTLISFLPLVAQAQVNATLVSEGQSIRAGEPFTVGLRFQHDPHWHTYWLNPGTGLATEIEWTLPEGFTASPIQWPAPHIIKDRAGIITGNGYEGDALLPITITPPADLKSGTTITLKAQVDWLMCEEICMPGDAQLSITLPVSDDAPEINGDLGQRLRAVVDTLPVALESWNTTASRSAKTITLHVAPNADATHFPQNLRFYADDNLVAYELPQIVNANDDGSFTLKMPVSPESPDDTTELNGVLTSENGWLADGSQRGLRIDVPFSDALANSVPNTGQADGRSFAGILSLAFLGGLILNLMPCVFPVLGIKILGFVNQSGSDRRKVAMHGIAFTVGVLISFWALASALLLLRAGGAQLGWGFQLQSPVFVYGMAAFLLLFALNLSGVFEVGLSATGAGTKLQSREGFTGSFFTGFLATLVATPCSAPFLATALPAALSLPTAQALLIFTFIAIGLSTPYLLLSFFPAAVKILPRPGEWMETFKQFMAFPLYATVGWLLWVLAGQTADQYTALRQIAFALVMISMAGWVYGRFAQAFGKPTRQLVGRIVAFGLLIGGLWLGWPTEPADKISNPSNQNLPQVVWEEWSTEAVDKLRAEDRIIYVDFTARWCATCQTNKGLVFSSPEVLQYFADHNIAALRADWTKKDAKIAAELAKYNRSAVPFNVIWMPGQSEPIILPELLTAGTVLDALQK